ncbi:MAG: DUF4157 domain-containing protein [Chloroflexi bacterium]|nr:DUF4157 domain-containing protein [Chloroflexota bacterium]
MAQKVPASSRSMLPLALQNKGASHPKSLQRQAEQNRRPDKIPASVGHVLRTPGQPLDTQTRSLMEPRFGHDFSQVRVHADAHAAASAHAVNARAYTVGHQIVFAEQQYATTSAGRQLLAHELTHVVQQSRAPREDQAQGKLPISQPGDRFEQEADAVAAQVLADAPASASLTPSGPALQRETPGSEAEKKPAEQQEAGEVVAEGLKTVAAQAADNNPQVKKAIIDPIKDQLKGQWNRLGTGEKAATVGLGAIGLGLAGGTLLSDPAGRKQLEGVNLATPFTLIPSMPLSSFTYTLPSGDSPDKRLFKFETGFTADDLINLRAGAKGLPKLSFKVNMQWGYDPATERLTVLGGDASLGLVPGLSLSGGAYKDILRPPQNFIGPDGQTTQSKQSIPEFGKPQPIPDVRIMINVDLLKFKPGDLVRQIKSIF